MKSLKLLYKGAVGSARSKVAKLHMAMVLMVAAMFTAPVFATDPTFDPAPITAKITEYLGIAIVLATAIILGLWTMRLLGLLKPKH